MCILCVCQQKHRAKKQKQEAEYVEGRTKCTAEVRGRNNKKKTAQTHDCTAAQAAAIHTRLTQNKNTFPFVLHKPHRTK
ncbi:hypothetical protein TCDM_10716 [Trypanosoma cruzi Dm28c]|uniref:Uncharacterized protein n=1 Tax=Trypanosoma cruzi Dm28c TaxID=1416333 RepID=V5D2J1_TRYCR|nr:hypothetical protein TCDM_10716 [Trypanosoma cruzi Dm28c]